MRELIDRLRDMINSLEYGLGDNWSEEELERTLHLLVGELINTISQDIEERVVAIAIINHLSRMHRQYRPFALYVNSIFPDTMPINNEIQTVS